jgi:hypothetical protein
MRGVVSRRSKLDACGFRQECISHRQTFKNSPWSLRDISGQAAALAIRSGRFTALMALACFATFAQVNSSFTVPPGVPKKTMAEKVRAVAPSQRYALAAAPVTNLGPISDAARDQPPPRRGLLRVAQNRPIAPSTLDRGMWQGTPDGNHVWRLAVSSRNALGIRLHFMDFSVGDGKVWIHDQANPRRQTFGPYTGKGRNGDGDFWTEIIFSDSIEVEYQPAASVPASGRPGFRISELNHLWQLGGNVAPREADFRDRPANSLGTRNSRPLASNTTTPNTQCFLDAACYTDANSNSYHPEVDAASKATAFVLFSDSSGSYQCTGTMLNAPNASPLLLTAGHCINTLAQARSTTAVFNVADSSCQQPPFTAFTGAQLAALPQTNGIQLLAYADKPFLDESSDYEIHNDIDYSFVLLDDFPEWSSLSLSGYTAAPVAVNAPVASVSAPQGLSLKAAFGTRLDDVWANGYDIDQTSQGRIDSGSSGSGLFDSAGHLLGVLSTGASPCNDPNNCPNQDSCDVKGEFIATYSSFSSIYPSISQYLNQPVDSAGNTLPNNPAVFSAAPIYGINSGGYGYSVLTMNAPTNISTVEIHVGSPNGALLYRGGGIGTVTTNQWVTEGMVFYLQDVSSNQPLTFTYTIATATAHESAVTFTATPLVILNPDAKGLGSMTLNWDVPGASVVEVHINSASGALFTRQQGETGWAYAPGWVSDGMVFVLCEVSQNACSTANTVATLTAHVGSDPSSSATAGGASLVAFPNPVALLPGQRYGQTTLYIRAPGASVAEIHVNSPDGLLFARTGPSGSATTGPWVTDGMTFYLQDASQGSPGRTIATASITLQPTAQ